MTCSQRKPNLKVLKEKEKKKGKQDLHSDDTILRIASNMEPCAGIDECGIPALQHIVWIY